MALETDWLVVEPLVTRQKRETGSIVELDALYLRPLGRFVLGDSFADTITAIICRYTYLGQWPTSHGGIVYNVLLIFHPASRQRVRDPTKRYAIRASTIYLRINNHSLVNWHDWHMNIYNLRVFCVDVAEHCSVQSLFVAMKNLIFICDNGILNMFSLFFFFQSRQLKVLCRYYHQMSLLYVLILSFGL